MWDVCLCDGVLHSPEQEPIPSRHMKVQNHECRDFPAGPVVKNPPCNARDVGLIPCRGMKIPHAEEQLSLLATTTEPAHHN